MMSYGRWLRCGARERAEFNSGLDAIVPVYEVKKLNNGPRVFRIAFVLGLLLGACDDDVYCTPRHLVNKVAEAPDGTILWRDQCNYVYFSSRGTQYDISAGKHHETVQVPNEDR